MVNARAVTAKIAVVMTADAVWTMDDLGRDNLLTQLSDTFTHTVRVSKVF